MADSTAWKRKSTELKRILIVLTIDPLIGRGFSEPVSFPRGPAPEDLEKAGQVTDEDTEDMNRDTIAKRNRIGR